jgi:hypothetical protein
MVGHRPEPSGTPHAVARADGGALLVSGLSDGALHVAVVISGLFIVLYNNCKPYDAWQNNFLQQVCQLSIFFTLLAALMIRYNDARSRERDPEVDSPKDDDIAGVALLLVTTLPPASVFLMRVFRIDPEFLLYW